MEYNRLSKTIKNLVIGDFVIACYKRSPGIRFEIPYAGMAFYQPKELRNADFHLCLDKVKPDNSGKLLFGSSDFYVPTFLYQRDHGYYDWITTQKENHALSFRINEDWNNFTLYEDETGTNGERAFHEFGSLFSYAVLNHEACVLHGVVMEYEGKGILVTAASGTGKTTHTRMWRDEENALILNGDRCLCRKIKGIWYAYGMPWSGSSGEYINRKVPINAIVCLKQGKENTVRRMELMEATLAMMQRIYAPLWNGNLQNKAFDITEDLACMIPVLELSCTPTKEAVEVLKDALFKLGR